VMPCISASAGRISTRASGYASFSDECRVIVPPCQCSSRRPVVRMNWILVIGHFLHRHIIERMKLSAPARERLFELRWRASEYNNIVRFLVS
jgi:hypothetical protein